MKCNYYSRFIINEPGPAIEFIPENDRDRRFLERLLSEHPSIVSGFGRDPITMSLIHLTARLTSHASYTSSDEEMAIKYRTPEWPTWALITVVAVLFLILEMVF